MADPVVIRVQHSLVRNLSLPWHNIGQFAFSVVLIGVILAIFHRVDLDVVMFVMASAWAGITGVSLGTAPAGGDGHDRAICRRRTQPEATGFHTP